MDALLDLTKDIWDFLRVRKKYWLAPLIITIVLMGALIVFTQGSVLAPFHLLNFLNDPCIWQVSHSFAWVSWLGHAVVDEIHRASF